MFRLPRLPRKLPFLGQRGAMFGMDARIALLVAAILTAAGGITLMSRLERSKVEQSEMGMEILRQGILNYYQNVGINRMPDSIEEIFATNQVDNPNLKLDAWGNPWRYEHISSNVMVEGTPITVHFAILYSGGKNGVAESGSIASEFDYAQWATQNDDVGIKVSTRDIEMARKQEFSARGQLIIDKLQSYENAAYVEAQGSCEGTSPPGWCEEQDGKNYTQFSYYPASSLDAAEDIVYYARDVLQQPTYQSGDLTDMVELLRILGLPEGYARDPWGRTLMYSSNVTDRQDPPFAASICFSLNGENCFARAQ